MKMLEAIKKIVPTFDPEKAFAVIKYIVIFITYVLSFHYWFNEKTQYLSTLLMVFMNAIVFLLVSYNCWSNRSEFNKPLACIKEFPRMMPIFNKYTIVYYSLFFFQHIILFIVFVLYFLFHDNIVNQMDKMNSFQKATYAFFRCSVITSIVISWIFGALISVKGIMSSMCNIKHKVIQKSIFIFLIVLMLVSAALSMEILTFAVLFFKNEIN